MFLCKTNNLYNYSAPGTRWTANSIDPRGIVYFDLFGLDPQKEFIEYVNPHNVEIGFNLPTANN